VKKQRRFAPMAKHTARRELLAPREDVWAFLSEPNRLADWWPGLRGVHPDRRGLAPGARWRTQGAGKTNPLVGPQADVTGTLVFLEVEPPSLARWQFVNANIDVELRLTESGPDRTQAELTVEVPMLSGLKRLPARALARLYALCQTAAPA
jgi:uncharacterized protein YndB with AHSA1/START domain